MKKNNIKEQNIKENKKIVVIFSIVIMILLIIVIILGMSKMTQKEIINKIYIFSQNYAYTGSNTEKTGIITNYQEYKELLNELEINENSQDEKITQSNFNKYAFLYYAYPIDSCYEELKFDNVEIKDQIAIINFDVNVKCEYCNDYLTLYLIPIVKEKAKEILEVQSEFEVVKEADSCFLIIEKKPILYLYPKKETNININIKLKYSDRITTSYPKYNNGWQVFAHPNGDLYDQNNKYYYALYWDEKNNTKVNFEEGFYVTKDNAISFLEEKLTIIGLNQRERNEFIMYWLPKLEKNEQNLIYFELTEERQKNNELIIEPTPDSLLRVNIHIKKVVKSTKIKEQKLSTFKRKGFVAVEWGGTIH